MIVLNPYNPDNHHYNHLDYHSEFILIILSLMLNILTILISIPYIVLVNIHNSEHVIDHPNNTSNHLDGDLDHTDDYSEI